MTAIEESTTVAPARPIGPPDAAAPAGLRKFRPDIEGLRAVAVVTVVLAHAELVFTGGYVGVDVFFVISGFLITRQLADELAARGRINFATFYARRFKRILPAATVVLLATLLASWAWLSPLRIASIVQDAVFAALSAVNWRLAGNGTDYFQAAAAPSPFQHYWSLAVEEQFYIVWPLVLVLSATLLGRLLGRRRAVVAALLVIVGVSFALSVTLTASAAPWAYFGSHTRAWELALGALVAVTAHRWARLPVAIGAAASWLGLGMIGWAAWTFTSQTIYPGSQAALPVLGSVLVIAGGCAAPRWGAELVLAPWPMQFLGKMSYSWYLWHWPVLLLLPAALDRDPDPTLSMIAIAGSLVLAILTHRLVEEPFRRSTGLVQHPQRGIMLGTTMVAMSVGAALVVGAVVVVPNSGLAPGAVNVALSPAAVVDATTAEILPADLTPTLESALRDQANSRSCFVDYFGTAPDTGPDCLFGDPDGTRTMVLFGDSHAAQWAGPVFAWAAQHDTKVWFMVKSSCLAGLYPDYVVPALQRVYTECNQWREGAFDFMREIRPDMVVIGSLSKGAAITPGGMTETTRILRDAGAEVLYIADNPYMGIDPPSCLAQHSDDIQKCSVPRSTAGLEEPARLAEIEGALAGGATVWDPIPYLCVEVCPSVIGNVGVYRDENHLTNTFTTSLLPQLTPVFSELAGD